MQRRKARETGIETSCMYAGLLGGILFGRNVSRRTAAVGLLVSVVGLFVGVFIAEDNGWSETMDVVIEFEDDSSTRLDA